MLSLWIRKVLYQGFIRGVGKGHSEEKESAPGSKSAIVFSPHFDDETLGCGGAIIRKSRAGARVRIVFMTDGTASHRHLASEKALKEMRSAEGVSAALALGVKAEDVTLLGFKEGALAADSEEAETRIADIIRKYNPDEVFIPHENEPLLWSADHRETTRIVKQALRKLEMHPVILEYPVWYWYHWPWVRLNVRDRNYRRVILKNTLAQLFGLRIGHDFNYSVPLEGVLEQKQKALEEHRSQMSRIMPDNKWITLKDISDGEFLECFFRDHELFNRYTFQK